MAALKGGRGNTGRLMRIGLLDLALTSRQNGRMALALEAVKEFRIGFIEVRLELGVVSVRCAFECDVLCIALALPSWLTLLIEIMRQ